MDISIIIVNYNVKYFLEQCLYSLVKACDNIDAEIFVVDNNSDDGSKGYLESKFPNIIFKWNKTNVGFAKANNSVLSEARGKYVLFLNPDTILPEDCLRTCFSFFEKNESCGALGVRMIDGSGKFLRESKRGLPSPATSFFKMLGLASLFPSSRTFAGYYAGHLPEHENNEVYVLAGAFLMSRDTVLKTVQGFDENFFMYGEDVDLSYRIQQAGFKNYYVADTTIIHFKGESTTRVSRSYIRHFYGAMKLFVSKHYRERKGTFLFMQFAINAGILLATLKLFFKKLLHSKRGPAKQLLVFIVAGQQRFNELLQLIKFAAKPVMIKGRIAIRNDDRDAATGKLPDIGRLFLSEKANGIIFCEGDISFKDIINMMEEFAGPANFLFHANNSNSIVGSNSKNKKGLFIARS